MALLLGLANHEILVVNVYNFGVNSLQLVYLYTPFSCFFFFVVVFKRRAFYILTCLISNKSHGSKLVGWLIMIKLAA